MTTIYRVAHGLAKKGIPTFPCAPGGKRPLTPRGLHDASTDPDVIERWAQQHPVANLGVLMGSRSGLFAIDIDQHSADGMQTLCGLEQTLGALPVTLTVATPSGGEHRYFRMPTAATLRNSAGRLGPGIDTRGEGGYTLFPPSAIDGRSYRWTTRATPAELPNAWIAALTPEQRTAPVAEWMPRNDRERAGVDAWCVRALQREARGLAGTPGGARNDRLWRAAAALGGLVHAGGISAEDVRRALTWACSQWERRDTRKDADTLERGIAFGLAHPRSISIGDDRAA